jgi:toxin ParE1/3/4
VKSFFHEEADAEATEAAYYYENEQQGLARRFVEEIEEARRFIEKNPEACAVVGNAGVRRKIIHGFPYSLAYVIDGDVVRILAVAHHKRRPLYFRNRL